MGRSRQRQSSSAFPSPKFRHTTSPETPSPGMLSVSAPSCRTPSAKVRQHQRQIRLAACARRSSKRGEASAVMARGVPASAERVLGNPSRPRCVGCSGAQSPVLPDCWYLCGATSHCCVSRGGGHRADHHARQRRDTAWPAGQTAGLGGAARQRAIAHGPASSPALVSCDGLLSCPRPSAAGRAGPRFVGAVEVGEWLCHP